MFIGCIESVSYTHLNYINTSEFKLSLETAPTKEQEQRTALEAEIKESGLIWDEVTQTYVEDKGVY